MKRWRTRLFKKSVLELFVVHQLFHHYSTCEMWNVCRNKPYFNIKYTGIIQLVLDHRYRISRFMGKNSRYLFFISTIDYQGPLNWPLTCSFYSWLVAKHNKRVKWHVTLYDEELTFVPKLNSLNSSESQISSQKLHKHWTMLPWKCATGDASVRRTRFFFLVPCHNSQTQHSQRTPW